MSLLVATDRQLVLSLPRTETFSAQSFIRAASNQAAKDAVEAWPNWPGGLLIIDGPVGAGKTHLARLWQAEAGAAWFDAADLGRDCNLWAAVGAYRHAAVDDAELCEQVPLLQIFNIIRERQGSVMLTASAPLAAWLPRLPDLASRLLTGWTAHIGAPQEELLAAVLYKQFGDRQLRVSPDVVRYLVTHMDRSFAFARHLVNACDRASLHAKRPLTLPLARAVLSIEMERLDAGDE